MGERHKYIFDRRSKRITAVIITIVVLAFGLLYYFGDGGYVPAWFLSLIIATVALYILSIPRYVQIKEEALQIHCILEMTNIPLKDLKTISKVDNRHLRYCIPLLGSYGFFGYYGYYFNIKKWETIKVYASEWKNFVEIEDIYETKVVISCADPDKLISETLSAQQQINIQ